MIFASMPLLFFSVKNCTVLPSAVPPSVLVTVPAPFAVTPEARDRWLLHMRAGVDALALPPELETPLWDYLVAAAHSMVNTFTD